MSPLPVPARRLHERPVRLRDAVALAGASLFPFFDSGGTVEALMLVWPASSAILLLEIEPALVRVPWLGPVEIDADFAEQRDAGADAARALAGGLWHYDPWWVLKAARYRGHPAAEALAATNCVDLFPKRVAECFFARDLARVAGFARRSQAGVKIDSAFIGLLASHRPKDPNTARRAAAGWRLDPFWQRQAWRLRLAHGRARQRAR